MISDADYFYIWQLFTIIFFLFQAVNCFMISDAHWYLLNILWNLVQKVMHRLFKKVVQYCHLPFFQIQLYLQKPTSRQKYLFIINLRIFYNLNMSSFLIFLKILLLKIFTFCYYTRFLELNIHNVCKNLIYNIFTFR